MNEHDQEEAIRKENERVRAERAKREAERARRQAETDQRLAAMHGVTVEQIQQGRANDATRKRRGWFFFGWFGGGGE